MLLLLLPSRPRDATEGQEEQDVVGEGEAPLIIGGSAPAQPRAPCVVVVVGVGACVCVLDTYVALVWQQQQDTSIGIVLVWL